MSATSSNPTIQKPTLTLENEKPFVEKFEIKTNVQLSTFLELKSLKLLTWLGKSKSEHYSVLRIRKRGSGKFRIIHDPSRLMRNVQYRILKKILEKVAVADYIHAFERDHSIPAMAAMHVGKKLILSLDIKDFFQSIKQRQLLELFLNLGFGDKPATTLSELCTYKSFVPQGALTSPKISNIIATRTFGPLIKEFCDQNNYTLSIYADDITISMDEWHQPVHEIIATVSEMITRFGFRINNRKTKIMGKHQRQWVCGVVVNEKTNMLRTERLKLRAMVHNVTTNGLEAEAAKTPDQTASQFLSRLSGRLNWLRQLNPTLGQKLIDNLDLSVKSKAQEEDSEMVKDICNESEAVSSGPAPWLV